MIKNIPNKYKLRNFLLEIDRKHKGKYNFLYLPIDFRNQANVGYAFINFLHPLLILEFYEEFYNRKWGMYHSAKVCDLKYARI